MSEQQNEEFSTGQRSIEESQGYLPPLPDTSKAEAQAAEDKSINDYIERTTELNRATIAGEDMPLDLGYNKADGSGRIDERHPVSARKAAEDISRWREGLAETDAAIKDAALSDEIDRLRGEAAQPQPQAPAEPVALDQQVQPPPLTTQSGQPLPPELQGEDSAELVRAFQQNPKLLEAVQTLSWQADQRIATAEQQALQYAEMQKQQAEQFVQANANNAIAGVFVRHPELQGLSYDQLPTALAMIQRTNPEKHAAIMHEVNAIQGLLQQANQVQFQQQQRATQQYHQQFHTWSGEEDSKFVKAHPEMADSATASNVTQRTRAYVHQKGFSDDDISRAWSGQAHLSLRDARVQSMLYDAMRYREAVAAVPAARANKPVKMQVPGPTGQRASEQDYDLRDLSNKLNSSHSAKDAAALLAARRARSR